MIEILQALLQGISHSIRTPLSVVSNDLTYFKTLIDPEECERSLVRIRDIAAFLRTVTNATKLTGEFQNVSLKEWIESSRFVSSESGEPSSSLTVRIVPEDFDKFHELFCSLFLKFHSEFQGIISDISDAGDTVRIRFRSALSLPQLKPNFHGVKSRNLTDFFCTKLETDSFIPPVIDTIALSRGYQFQAEYTGESLIIFLTLSQGAS